MRRRGCVAGTHIVNPRLHQVLRRAPVKENPELAPSPLVVVLVHHHNLDGATRRPRATELFRKPVASRLQKRLIVEV